MSIRARDTTGLLRTTWEKLLLRWSGMDATPETKLACAVIAQTILDEQCGYSDSVRTRFGQCFFDEIMTGGTAKWCHLLGIDPVYLSEQIERCLAADVDGLRAACK